MSDDYVREKLALAVDALAASAAPIQTRLADAAVAMVSLNADDFAGAEESALGLQLREDLRQSDRADCGAEEVRALDDARIPMLPRYQLECRHYSRF